jgi:DDE family transposase
MPPPLSAGSFGSPRLNSLDCGETVLGEVLEAFDHLVTKVSAEPLNKPNRNNHTGRFACEIANKKVKRIINVEIVKRSDTALKFVVLPKRWVVERTFAWLNRGRRLAKEWEN